MKRILVVFLISAAVFLSLTANAKVSRENITEITEKAAACVLKNTPEANVSYLGGEWAVIGLLRSGTDVPGEYFDRYYRNVRQYTEEKSGALHRVKYTEYSRVILALTAMGKDPSDVSGYNLLEPLGDFDKTVKQGINGAIWALISLDSADYPIPYNKSAKTHATRAMYKEYILDRRNSDGGWSFSEKSDVSETDITAMALIALSRYAGDKNVSEAIDKALEFLSESQAADGGYGTSESTSQVICALDALGIDILNDTRFIKDGNTAADALYGYFIENSGFLHTKDAASQDPMATEQALYALAALKRSVNSEPSLFDMRDVRKKVSINVPKICREGVSFDDIGNSVCKEKITELAKRGIVNGRTENTFVPDGLVTRAEFSKILVFALGIDEAKYSAFSDVNADDWFYKSVTNASFSGLVKGVSETLFEPNGYITKEQCAVMLSRAADFTDTNKKTPGEKETNQTLGNFSDAGEISDWARADIAFCINNKIIAPENDVLSMRDYASREWICGAVYNLLEKSELLK